MNNTQNPIKHHNTGSNIEISKANTHIVHAGINAASEHATDPDCVEQIFRGGTGGSQVLRSKLARLPRQTLIVLQPEYLERPHRLIRTFQTAQCTQIKPLGKHT